MAHISREPVRSREVRFMVSRLQGEQVNGVATPLQLAAIKALEDLAEFFAHHERKEAAIGRGAGRLVGR